MAHNGVPAHDHSQCKPEEGECFSLYSFIDRDELICYNELENNSIKTVFKPYDLRADKSDCVESDADEQLIIQIPFNGVVKLKSFVMVGGGGGSTPQTLKMFTNRDDINFENVESLKPVQEWTLAEEDAGGDIEYPTVVTKFGSCRSITMFISQNYGADRTKIHYIGLKGEFTPLKREPVRASYELVPAAAKNTNPVEQGGSHPVS